MITRCTRVRVLLLLGLACSWVTNGQRLDMKVLGNRNLIEIPFDLENDFIVISVLLNNTIPLRFIVDTGAENTVLLDRRVTDLLDVNYRRSFQVRGADIDNELLAHLATGVNLRLADRLLARNRSILVLQENYFNFERITGTNIHGILGADFLMRFVLEIDFRKQLLVLHDPTRYRHPRSLTKVPATFVRNRPYLLTGIGVLRDSTTDRRLLMDTGAGLSLLLHSFVGAEQPDLPEQTIPTYIASGLGGTLNGSVGRSRTVEVGDRMLTGVVTYFHEVDTAGLLWSNDRDGLIGTQLLKRFRVVIDYPREAVYLRAEGRRWKQKFRFDRSGLSLLAGGDNLRMYSVSNVVPGSPAERAGVQVRDRLRAINGISTNLLSLEGIIRKLQGRVGKKIRLRVYREGRLYELTFRLEELI
ncbi:PDZ domain-containing protein [Lewinella sp. IMCC34183]|uniref:PDZ domain-containing protein n=1 Tax=Lewinella sp. IMCC34183 TaxID=2248762 RepID=UPI000E257150|nr:PDZ domain-containing protein [Lewinella sp. IMCC34183]